MKRILLHSLCSLVFILEIASLKASSELTWAVDSCQIFADAQTTVVQSDCNGKAVVCTNIDYQKDWLYRITADGSMVDAQQPCNFDTLRYYAVLSETILSNTFAPFFVRWTINGRVFSSEFNNINALIELMNSWDVGGNWFFETQENFIVGGRAENNYGKLTIEILLNNTSIVAEYSTRLIPKSSGILLPPGQYRLVAQDLTTSCMDTVEAKVICTTKDTMAIALDIGQTRTVCLDDQELFAAISSLSGNPVPSDFYRWQKTDESCFQITGTALGTDSSYFVVCDQFGICDSTLLIVSVRKKLSKVRQLVARLGTTNTFCINRNELALPGNIVSFDAACEQTSPMVAALSYDLPSLCLTYTGVAVGKDSVCAAVCDYFGNCDTLQFRIIVAEPEVIFDTVFINVDRVQQCLDISGLLGLSILMDETCQSQQPNTKLDFQFDPKTFCVEYAGKELGRDSACVWLIDEFGNAKLTIFQITIVQPTAAYVQDSIFVNETITFCADVSELRGKLTRFFNICPRSSGDLVDFFINSDNCLEITGIDLGKEEACLVLCDDLGFCDTTFLTIIVVPYQFPPQAVNDIGRTDQNNPVIIDVQANDNIVGGIQVLSVVNPPKYGRAIVLSNGTIQYFPDKQSCRGRDEFTYLICNNVGCANANVVVEILCDGVEVYSGFSPNGDGWNEVFFIANIESKPDNYLRVYNRWGNLVYEVEGYKNNWTGTWNGKLLPEGTYFYILEVEEEGGTLTYRGAVEIHR